MERIFELGVPEPSGNENDTFVVDLPRNVLVDQEGDLYVVDAEIKRL